MSGTESKKLKTIHKLLQQCTSLELVSDFLKSKNLTHSAGSWKDMLEKRLAPAIENRQLKIIELVEFLESAEGHGKQHVFLYQATINEDEILNTRRLNAIIEEQGWQSLIKKPLVLELPKKPTVGSISIAGHANDVAESISIKVVETRETQQHVGDTVRGKFINKRYEIVTERAVSIAKLHKNGLLELRIGSRSNTTKYKDDLLNFWTLINKLFPRDSFRDYHLSNVKNKLSSRPPELSGIVRYSQSVMRDPQGITMKLATGQPDSDLTTSAAARGSSDAFSQNEGSCESSNIWFIASGQTPIARDLHILLGGLSNEFAITQHCTKEDYEYALGQLLSLNA